ncbi:ADP-ribosyltransferase [Nocardia sp. NPDC059177]|uniref:ADP-ribosyltransferase n=1 Tax=Nocardia sp. NPDC059177 TaxID=3346759 RepID=UPI0036AC4D67
MNDRGGGTSQFDGFLFAERVLAGQTTNRLTAAEREAIESYALNGYERIISALRGLTPMTAGLAHHIASIRSGLQRYPLPQTVRVTREVDASVLGIDTDDHASLAAVIGDYFTELGFLSTSGSEFPPKSRRHVQPVILELLVPEGTPALRLAELAEVQDEKEVLVIDMRMFLVVNTAIDDRRSMWRIEAIVVQEEQ